MSVSDVLSRLALYCTHSGSRRISDVSNLMPILSQVLCLHPDLVVAGAFQAVNIRAGLEVRRTSSTSPFGFLRILPPRRFCSSPARWNTTRASLLLKMFSHTTRARTLHLLMMTRCQTSK